MSADVDRAFRPLVTQLLEAFPALPHRWTTDSSIVFPAQSAEGFEVSAEASPYGVTVGTDTGFHLEFDDDEPAETCIRRALTAVLAMLSADTRLREFRSNEKPYRWDLELFREGRWHPAERTALLFWNFLGHRSEITLQNHFFSTCPDALRR